MIKRSIILVFFLIFFPRNAYPQFEQFYESWRWAHFTTASGLPSDVVEAIIETDNGIPWVSTPKGLAWYDGYDWKSIVIDSAKPHQRSRTISPFFGSKLFVIQDGDLYVGDTHGFEKINFQSVMKVGIVSSVAAIDSLTFMCVYETNDSAHVLKIHNNNIDIINSHPPGRVYQSTNTQWFTSGLDMGLYYYKDAEWKKIFTPIGEPIAIRNITENVFGEGIIAIDAPKNKIGLWEFKNKEIIALSRTERNQPIRSVSIANNSDAIAVYESGEIHLRMTKVWYNLEPIPRQMTNILSVQYRNNNDIWIATENGLFLFKRHQSEWKKTDYPFSDPRSIVMEIFQSKNNEIWIGHMDGLEIHKTDGSKIFIASINGTPLGLVTGINQDSKGHIWVCAGGGVKGLFEWDGRQWHHYFKDEIGFHKIRKDQKGNLWFLGLGTKKNDPAGYYLQNSNFYRIDSLINLPSNRIYSFAESKNGTIWIGTSEGLIRKTTDKATYWGKEIFGKNAKVYTIAVDSNENIWFSTFSSYLGTINTSDSIRWVWKREEQHEYNNKIWDINIDDAGILWVASAKGLFRFYNNTWSNYGNITGANIKELRVVLSTKDDIYIGGHGIGVRSINREINIYPIRVTISKPIVENNEAYCSWNPAAFWGNISSNEIETRYRLNEGEWSEWTKQNSTVFKGLKSGYYSISVQSKDQTGNIYDGFIEQQFEIKPPIYFQPVFYIPIIFLCSVIVAISVQSYRAKQEFKLALLDQRIQLSNDLHDDVGSNLGSISLIGQRAMRNTPISAEVMQELKLISDIAVNTAGELRDIVWYINPQNDSMESLGNRMRETVERYLRDYDLEFTIRNDSKNDGLTVGIRHDIMLLFKELVYNIAKHSEATRVTILIEHTSENIRLLISDNGKGFDPEKKTSGAGMRSIRRRVERMKGKLTIDTAPGRGTAITVSVNKS